MRPVIVIVSLAAFVASMRVARAGRIPSAVSVSKARAMTSLYRIAFSGAPNRAISRESQSVGDRRPTSTAM
jgi:hypothetical protein